MWVSTGKRSKAVFRGKMLDMKEFAGQQKSLRRKQRKQAIRLGLPAALVTLLLSIMVVVIYLAVQDEKEQNTNKLIADTLWARQNIQFQIEGVNKALLGLSSDQLLLRNKRLDDAIAQIYRGNEELIAVFQGKELSLISSPSQSDTTALLLSNVRRQIESVAMARLANGIDGFLGPISIDGRSLIVNVYPGIVPTQGLVAVFDLGLMLERQLPWWFVQDNEVELLSPTGATLARLSKGTPGRGEYTHVASLELLGVPFRLRVNNAMEGPRLFGYGTSGALVVLVLLLLASFALLWRDSKKRLQVEAQLEDEKRFRQAMQDSVAVGMRVWDLGGVIRYVNPAFCNMVGYGADELVGKPQPLPYWPQNHTEEYQRLVAKVISGNSPREGFETSYQHKNGHMLDVLIVEAPLRDAEGVHVGWMSSVLDITDRKRSEVLIAEQKEKLQSASRFALVGEVASNIAHELNQPLATMVSFAQAGINLSQRGAKVEKYVELFAKLRDQAQRASRVVGSVQNLVRKRRPMREAIQLTSLELGLLPSLQSLADGRRVTLSVQSSSASGVHGEVFIDRIMVEQAVVNLVKNAVECFPDSSLKRNVWVTFKLDGKTFEVIVKDNGPGLSLDEPEKLFESLVSTKPDGLGLGLSLCRSVAEAHAGRLTVSRVVEGGTEFRLSLPSAVKMDVEGEVGHV